MAPAAPPLPPTAALQDLSVSDDADGDHSSYATAPSGAPVSSNARANSGLRARVLFDYVKEDDDEMDLVEGEILERVDPITESWWMAEGDEGRKSGTFPSESRSIGLCGRGLGRRGPTGEEALSRSDCVSG
jgi:hypothetical protein